jgi:hypothetical protein
MEFLSDLKIDFTLFLGIIGICEYVKSVMGEGLKKLFWIVPLIVTGVGVLLLSADTFIWKTFLYNYFLYLGVAILLYEVIVKLIKNKITQLQSK